MDHKKAFRSLLITTFLIVFLVAAFNVIVNPYEVFPFERIKNINQKKPNLDKFIYKAKEIQYSSYKPKTILIGNSRTSFGINPKSHSWPDSYKPVYNYGIPGYTTREYLADLHELYQSDQHKPDNIFLFLDFIDFIEKPKIKDSKNDDSKLNNNLSYLKAVLSIDAFIDSIKTVYSQRNRYARDVTPEGFYTLQNIQEVIVKEGQSVFLKKKIIDFHNMFPKDEDYIFNYNDKRFDDLLGTMDLMMKAGTKVYIVLYPYHEFVHEYFQLEKQLDQFKRKLHFVVDKENRFIGSKRKIQLWDFAEINEYTSEELPQKRTDPPMKWHWEIGHFNHKLGDKMIEAIFSKDQKSSIGKRID